MVETQDGEVSITRPELATTPSTDAVVAHSWALHVTAAAPDSGDAPSVQIVPHEFVRVADLSPADHERLLRANALLAATDGPGAAFVADLGVALVATRTEASLGLQVMHREGLKDSGSATPFLSETSEYTSRTSTVRAVGDREPDTLPVFWRMSKDATFCLRCLDPTLPHDASVDDCEGHRCVHVGWCGSTHHGGAA